MCKQYGLNRKLKKSQKLRLVCEKTDLFPTFRDCVLDRGPDPILELAENEEEPLKTLDKAIGIKNKENYPVSRGFYGK